MTKWIRKTQFLGKTLKSLLVGMIGIATLFAFGDAYAFGDRAQPTISPWSQQGQQDVVGDWQGTLEFPGSGKFRLVLRIVRAADGTLSALNYSIDQGPEPMHTTGVSFSGSLLRFAIPALGGSYEGQLSSDGNAISGTYTQTNRLPLNFVRATKETAWEIPVRLPTSKPMATDADPSFGVATIKPSSPDSSEKYFRVIGRRFKTQNTTLADLIEVAYGVHPKQIVGAPGWVVEAKFDLVGVPDGEGEPSGKQWTMMVQKLLVSRFGLVLHHEMKDLSVYVLSAGKSGSKNLQQSTSSNPLPSLEFSPAPGGVTLPARNASMAQFAEMMQAEVLDRPVVDKTGLVGRFDFQLTFLPNDSQFNGHPPFQPAQSDGANAAPSLFDAMQQQLGLKLNAEKSSVDVLVIDHVERPSEN